MPLVILARVLGGDAGMAPVPATLRVVAPVLKTGFDIFLPLAVSGTVLTESSEELRRSGEGVPSSSAEGSTGVSPLPDGSRDVSRGPGLATPFSTPFFLMASGSVLSC
nr:hypothetical protein [uncultured Neokomagataea sp.]